MGLSQSHEHDMRILSLWTVISELQIDGIKQMQIGIGMFIQHHHHTDIIINGEIIMDFH